MTKLTLSVAALLLMSACANKPKTVAQKPIIKSIAIIPATNPSSFTLENVSAVALLIPLAATVNYVDSKEKAKVFNEKLATQQSSLGSNFTDAVATALRGYGYEVQILNGVTRPAGDIDNVDYEKITAGADAVLHLRFSQVGLFSPRSSNSYLPRVNALGTLFSKGQSDYLYDQEIYYGVDARKDKTWAIASDDKFSYVSFEAVVANIESVRKAFEAGTGAISMRMSEQIHDSIK